jgi:RNA polymerase sigma-70 factor (ECF subfamily)
VARGQEQALSIPLDLAEPEARARAFTELLEGQTGAVLGLARRLLGDGDEARDLAQDALLRAHRALPGFRGDSSLKTWVLRIVVHEGLKRLRRRRLKDRVHAWLGGQPGAAPGYGLSAVPGPEELTRAAEERARLARALGVLPARQRAAVVLRYLEGLGVPEVAEVMGLGQGSVKTHLVRALRRLRRELEPR